MSSHDFDALVISFSIESNGIESLTGMEQANIKLNCTDVFQIAISDRFIANLIEV